MLEKLKVRYLALTIHTELPESPGNAACHIETTGALRLNQDVLI